MINYKTTLNLPSTKFPMKGNLSKSELVTIHKWNKDKLYKIVRISKKGKKIFLLHDGPPYANCNIHIGHSVNKILKDIIIKSKGFDGYDAPFIPGWDCHGLPIEMKVEKIFKKSLDKINISTFLEYCRYYANQQIIKQKKDFIRLGILGDWEKPYLTMNFFTEANTVRVLGKIISNGYLVNKEKPVYWCIDCKSSLAEAEIEYFNKYSTSIYVKFLSTNIKKIVKKFCKINFFNSIYIIIWTTTPWTLPANCAISVNPNFNYKLIEINGKGYILAEKLLNNVMFCSGIKNWKILGNIKGSELEFMKFYHPFMKYEVPIVLSNHVTLSSGTGAVHIAPNHGLDDYILGKKYNIKYKNLVDSNGCYLLKNIPNLNGLNVLKVDNIIINLLKNNNSLFYIDKINHSYPHCWRHKTPVIFRATPQWFINIDHNNLRNNTLKEIKKVKWIPKWGEKRIKSMISNRPDWCISRQRIWGIPMTLFVHKKTNKLHPKTDKFIELIAKMIEKKGIKAWWDLNPKKFLGEESKNYNKILDTLDIWFESGSTHTSVIAKEPNFSGHVSDMYLEGSDQHRGWFMSSLMISTAIYGKAPYKQVLTHGFTVDNHGKKMSKSIGNVLSPQKIIDKFGADVLRLWVASNDYSGEISVSDDIIKRSSDVYRRIRNTARFLLANLKDFNPVEHIINPDKMVIIDLHAINLLKKTQKSIIIDYHNYDFHNIIKKIMQFCSIEMGSFYFDIVKDRLYTLKKDSISRKSCQTVLYYILEAMVRWIAPIMSFTANEIWNFLPGKRSKYIFTEEWYNNFFQIDSKKLLINSFWSILSKIKNETNKLIEKGKKNKYIGNSLETQITFYVKSNLAKFLKHIKKELCFVVLSSKIIIREYKEATKDAIKCTELKELKISLEKVKGEKCPRCWHYKINFNSILDYKKLCNRCFMNTAGSGEERKFI